MTVKTFVEVNDLVVSLRGNLLVATSSTITTMAANAIIPDGQFRLKEKDFKMSLVHQSLIKPVKADLKALLDDGAVTPPSSIKIYDQPILREGIFEPQNGVSVFRSGFALVVDEKSQDDLELWVHVLLTTLGVEKREKRDFHISVSNLTGNPGDSLR